MHDPFSLSPVQINLLAQIYCENILSANEKAAEHGPEIHAKHVALVRHGIVLVLEKLGCPDDEIPDYFDRVMARARNYHRISIN